MKYLDAQEKNIVFNFPSRRELEYVSLCKLDELRFTNIHISPREYMENYNIGIHNQNINDEGYYRVPVIDIIRKTNDHSVRGILVWFPDLNQFGTGDTDHGVVYVFKNKTWKDIVENLDFYCSYQWYPSKNTDVLHLYEYCNPWEKWDFVKTS